MIIVPDEYLNTDVLMGADMIGQAKFTWDYKKKQDLNWGEQQYKVYKAVDRSIHLAVHYKERACNLEKEDRSAGTC